MCIFYIHEICAFVAFQLHLFSGCCSSDSFFFLFQKKTSNKSEIVKPNTYTWTKQDCRRKGEMGRGNKMFEFKRKWKQNKEKEDVFQNNNLFDANKTTKTTMLTMPNHFLAHIAEKWQQRNWINSRTKKRQHTA